MVTENAAEAGRRFRHTGLFLLILTGWLIVLGVAGSMVFTAEMDTAGSYLLSAVVELLLFLPAAVYMAARRIRLTALFGRADAAQIVTGAFLGLLLAPVTIAITACWSVLVMLTGGTLPQGLPAPQTAVQALAAFAAAGIAAPMIEEPIFRGLVMEGQAGAVRRGTAFFLTALSFALLHGQWIGLPAIFLGGLLMAALAWHSRSIWPAIAAHAAYNTVNLLFLIMQSRLVEELPVASLLLAPPLPAFPQASALMAGAMLWTLIALPFAAGAAAVLWGYRQFTPRAHRAGPDRTHRLGFGSTWPWFAAFFLLLAVLAIDVLQLYGIMGAING